MVRKIDLNFCDIYDFVVEGKVLFPVLNLYAIVNPPVLLWLLWVFTLLIYCTRSLSQCVFIARQMGHSGQAKLFSASRAVLSSQTWPNVVDVTGDALSLRGFDVCAHPDNQLYLAVLLKEKKKTEKTIKRLCIVFYILILNSLISLFSLPHHFIPCFCSPFFCLVFFFFFLSLLSSFQKPMAVSYYLRTHIWPSAQLTRIWITQLQELWVRLECR